jgi:hypothetical protein
MARSTAVSMSCYVSFTGVDQHFFGDNGILASNNPEAGTGRGVQLEALVSYYFTREFSAPPAPNCAACLPAAYPARYGPTRTNLTN